MMSEFLTRENKIFNTVKTRLPIRHSIIQPSIVRIFDYPLRILVPQTTSHTKFLLNYPNFPIIQTFWSGSTTFR